MSEFVVLQVGQCGNQIGSQFWNYALNEYGVKQTLYSLNTRIHTPKYQNQPGFKYTEKLLSARDVYHSFFWQPDGISVEERNGNKMLKARAILVDMEEGVVSRLKKGPLGHLFADNLFLADSPGSGNNWAEGHYYHGENYRDAMRGAVRTVAERCDSLQGFLLLCSLGGGTGSGVGTALLNVLKDEFEEVQRFVTAVFPSFNDDVVTSPYNTLLAIRHLNEHADCIFPVDNQALLDMCKRIENAHVLTKEVAVNTILSSDQLTPLPFEDMNNIVANMLLHITSSARFPGSLNVDINEICTNMVPFPKLHYLISSLSPLCVSRPNNIISCKVDDMFSSSLLPSNQLVKVDPAGGINLGLMFLGRGSISLSDLRRNVERLQDRSQFLPWTKDAVKVGLCAVPPVGHQYSLLTLMNNTSVAKLLEGVKKRFHKMYRCRAYIHHYLQVDGMEMEDFELSAESVNDVVCRYVELEREKRINLPRLTVL